MLIQSRRHIESLDPRIAKSKNDESHSRDSRLFRLDRCERRLIRRNLQLIESQSLSIQLENDEQHIIEFNLEAKVVL